MDGLVVDIRNATRHKGRPPHPRQVSHSGPIQSKVGAPAWVKRLHTCRQENCDVHDHRFWLSVSISGSQDRGIYQRQRGGRCGSGRRQLCVTLLSLNLGRMAELRLIFLAKTNPLPHASWMSLGTGRILKPHYSFIQGYHGPFCEYWL